MSTRDLLLLLISAAATATAQTPVVPAPASAAAKIADQRATPRSSFFGYLEACRAGDFRRAASFLNLEHARFKTDDGPRLASELKDILDRRLTSDPGKLSNAPEGDLADGLDPDYELLGTVQSAGKPIDLTLERVSREETQVWLISASTVRLISVLHDNLGSTWAEKHLPQWTLARGPLDTDVWQWFGLILLAAAGLGIAALLAKLIVTALTPIFKRTRTSADDQLLNDLAGPLHLLLGIALFQAGLAFIGPPVLLRAYLIRILTAVAYFALAWFAVRIIDLISAHLSLRMARQQLASARSVLPLGRRTAKVAIATVAILATLASWGYDTTAILAGLGVGGLAVALAAQKTIENLFGGVALTTDRPVLVGDFCKYGDKAGTVEDIGLRSTRLRTTDRTLVTIPNATFSNLTLENFAVRDKILLNPKLGLRNDTTPEQIRALVPALRQTLLNHPQVDPAPARVRFVGIGQWTLDIEVFAYVKTTDFDQFLIVQEELLLGFMEQIRNAGTALAIPAQLSYLATSNTPDSKPA